MKFTSVVAAVVTCLVATVAVPAQANEKAEPSTASAVNEDAGVPVFPYDITDRSYTVVGDVKAKVRKATIFSKEPSQVKIYRELWERAQKLGADAVIKASYGDAHVTAFSWGSSTATGTAIKFTSAPAAATQAPAAPSADSADATPSAQ